eukprot:1045740-Pelagomonas_calceolata.AAC.1
MQTQLESIINTHNSCTPIKIGDMNATAQDNDRTINNSYPCDIKYQKFLHSNNLSRCKEEAPRLWTHCQATGKDADNNIIYSFGRIDDIILPSRLTSTCTPCHTCKLGCLSDRIPLLLSIPTSSLGIRIPRITNLQPPKETPRQILARPVSSSDQQAFTQS